MRINVRPLTTDESAAREAGLYLAARLVDSPLPLRIDQVQALYNALLLEPVVCDNAAIALGLAFGEQIVARMGFEWVRVSDEYGDETCVSPQGKEIFCAPISMIQKRLQRREETNLARLRDEMIEVIQRRTDEGAVADRQ